MLSDMQRSRKESFHGSRCSRSDTNQGRCEKNHSLELFNPKTPSDAVAEVMESYTIPAKDQILGDVRDYGQKPLSISE